MGGILAAVVNFCIWAYGLFSKKPDAAAISEKLGQQETQNANAQAGLDEVQTAVLARNRNDAALADDNRQLLNGHDRAAAPYRPGPD